MQTIRALSLALLLGAVPVAAQETHQEWVATRYEVSLFDGGDEPWQLASVEAGSRGLRLTPIARVNWASRFEEDGVQLEADLYPAWPGVGYAYLSAGWSAGLPFPELRIAGELFATLPSAFEASAGVIWMDFAEDATILVGSLSRYAGNYWFAVRPSWALETEDAALSLLARRYLRTPGEFVTVRLLAGSTPEEIATRGTRLESVGVQADAQLELSRRWLVLPLAGVMMTQAPSGGGDPPCGCTDLRYTLGIGGMYRF